MAPPNPLPPDDAVRTVRRPDGTFTYLTESTITLQTSALESSVTLLESAVSVLEAIEQNTIDMEAILTTIDASLNAIESDADATRIAAQSIDTDVDVALSTRASEATLSSFRTETSTALASANSSLDAIESDADATRIAAQSIDTDVDVALSTRASEATLSSFRTETSTALTAANASLDAIESDADATRIAAQSIDTDVDVALSTRASESTLSALNGKLPATAALADATANPSLSAIQAFIMLYNGATWDRAETPQTANVTHNTVTVTTTATLIVASNATRRRVDIRNTSNQAVFLGDTNAVTAANGFPVETDDVFTEINYIGDIYGITNSGSSDVRYWEVN